MAILNFKTGYGLLLPQVWDLGGHILLLLQCTRLLWTPRVCKPRYFVVCMLLVLQLTTGLGLDVDL